MRKGHENKKNHNIIIENHLNQLMYDKSQDDNISLTT